MCASVGPDTLTVKSKKKKKREYPSLMGKCPNLIMANSDTIILDQNKPHNYGTFNSIDEKNSTLSYDIYIFPLVS